MISMLECCPNNPKLDGEFTSQSYDLGKNGQIVGTVNIGYFGPYFLSENDFQFLRALNALLIGIGALSLVFSVVMGWYMAKRLTSPILKTVAVAKQMSGGDTAMRIEEKSSIKELSELIGSVNHLADSLSTQENLRKQLTADVAHELRTPLTTVGAQIEAMIEGVWEPTPKRLQSCQEEIIRISKLVVDLENLAKVESGNLKLDKTYISLKEISEKVVRNYETEIRTKNLSVTIDGICPDIMADYNRISQVMINLLSNAIKYTPHDGSILVTISATADFVEVSVKDTGIGISEVELPFVFERFYRADKSRNRMTGGSGIGLAIVKSIITAHGGSVSVESRLNEGAEFKLKLPCLLITEH